MAGRDPRPWALAVLLAVPVGAAGLPATAAPATAQAVTYLVQVADASTGRAAASAARDAVLDRAAVAADRVVYRYSTFPGFAARLTPAQAATVARQPGVARLWRDEVREAQSISTPDFLRLTGATGVWQTRFSGAARAGEGVIVGTVDSGIAAGHPSFAALPEPRPDAAAIAAKWRGSCEAGLCNNKVIGARSFRAGAADVAPAEFASPRDYNGHGTHVAAVAAGNTGVPAVVDGVSAGTASGVAPAVRLAVYKALWQTSNGRLVGSTADIVAAIDQATADGVDVLNYSAAGATTTLADPVGVALYHAAAAGVFVAAAAGNGGAVGSIAPWVPTVAAGTHDRLLHRTLQLGDGTVLTGVGLGAGAVPATRLVDAAAAPASGATAADAELCRAGALNPAAVTGAVVLCKRGVTGRTDKSRAVQQAGGAGMVLYNDPDSTVDADFHAIPAVHLDRAAGLTVKAYASRPSPTAQLSSGLRATARAPAVPTWSSRGPAGLAAVPILKPDVLAPGVDVLAASAVAGQPTFALRSGSSVAAAQVSGVAALLIGRTPSLTPMAVKSALMTTATGDDDTGAPILRGAQAADPHDMGAGRVNPQRAFDPGLVFESTPAAWLSFACAADRFAAAGFGATACTGPLADPSTLNLPALAHGSLAHTVAFRRTVTNPTNQSGAYSSRITAPPGYSVTVSPTVLTVLPRRSATVTITVTRGDTVPGSWEFGDVKLTDIRSHEVRLPIAVRAVDAAVPGRVEVTGTSGTTTLPVTAGFTGTLNARALGPAAPQVSLSTLNPGGPTFNPATPTPSSRTEAQTVVVPEGGLARFATRSADHPAGTDIDLYVYRTSGAPVLAGSSNAVGSDEEVTVQEPGTYTVYRHLYAAPAPVAVRGVHWAVHQTSPSLVASPATAAVTPGTAAPVTVTWQGLAGGQEHLAVIELSDGQRVVARSTLTIVT